MEPIPLQPIVEELTEDFDRVMALDSSYDDNDLFDALAQDICTLMEDSDRSMLITVRLLDALAEDARPYSPETTERPEEDDEDDDYINDFDYTEVEDEWVEQLFHVHSPLTTTSSNQESRQLVFLRVNGCLLQEDCIALSLT